MKPVRLSFARIVAGVALAAAIGATVFLPLIPVVALASSGAAQKAAGASASTLTAPIAQIPTMLNGWTIVTSATPYGNLAPLRYWKDGAGWVHVEGFVTGGTNASAVLKLPVGYRPAGTMHFLTADFGNTLCPICVHSDGNLLLNFANINCAPAATTAIHITFKQAG